MLRNVLRNVLKNVLKNVLWVLLIWTLLAVSCAPAKIPPSPETTPTGALSEDAPFGPRTTLEELLESTLRLQYPPLQIAFPVPDHSTAYFVELAHEPAILHLASGVSAHVAGPSGLAAGLTNGDIRIWSPWPCPALTLPQEHSVTLLSWNDSGPLLGAGHGQSGEVFVYDLRHCAQVAKVSVETPLRTAAFSPSLTWAAVVDAGRRLLVGPVQGPLRHAGTLRFQPLALNFSPREGLLQAVDQAGWLVLWTLPELDVFDQVLIPGGPFEAAMFHDQHLSLKRMHDTAPADLPEQGAASVPAIVVWDIPASRSVSTDILPAPSLPFHGFRLESGMLVFHTPEKRWLRKLHFGEPGLKIHVSAASGLLRITDLDQVQRWYTAHDGFLVDPPDVVPEDLRPLHVDPAGNAHWGGVTYALADPVMHQDGFTLLARYTPVDRFFLWWTASDQPPAHPLPDNGLLPIRESLRRELPPAWVPLSGHHQNLAGEAP